MSDLKDGYLDVSASKKVDVTYYQQLQEFVLREGDFLMGMSGSLGNYARVTVNELQPEFESDEDRMYFLIRLPVHAKSSNQAEVGTKSGTKFRTRCSIR
ncbi:hypothetical protein KAR34_14300 [bacterium]|nr:hypothetical protein [bacterium]